MNTNETGQEGIVVRVLSSVMIGVILVLMGGAPATGQGLGGLAITQMTSSKKGHFLKPELLHAVVRRLPAPPEPGSLAAQADLETELQIQAWRTDAQVAFAKEIDEGGPFDFAAVLGPWFTAEHLPSLKKLLKQVGQDAGAAGGLAKQQFRRLRPPYVDVRVQPCIETPAKVNFSYPSGHATLLYVEALVLGELFPDRRTELLAWAHKAAWGRILAGVHFPSDDVGGLLLAEALMEALRQDPEVLARIEHCRAEAAPFLLAKAG